MSSRGGGRGSRGGSGNSRGGRRGGSASGFGSPQYPSRGGGGGGRGGNSNRGGFFGSPQSRQLSDFASPPPKTPVRNNSAPGQGSGGKGRNFASPGSFQRGNSSPSLPSSVIPLGEFHVDERAYKGSVSLSLKFGGTGLEDGHIESVVIVWMRTQFEPYIRRVYNGYPRDQIQVNFELQDNYLTSVGVAALVRYLSEVVTSATRAYRITALKLWNNQIDDAGCEALGDFLPLLARCDVPLVELHLSHNYVTEKGCAAIMNGVHSYARADTKLTKLNTSGNGGNPATSSAVATPTRSASSPFPASSNATQSSLPSKNQPDASVSSPTFVLPPNCLDTGIQISPPPHPLWLRLEWNSIQFKLFQPNFAWLAQEPNAIKRQAKQARRAAQKAAAVAGSVSTVESPSPAALTRQSSQESTDVEEQDDGAAVGAKEEEEDVDENADDEPEHDPAADDQAQPNEQVENEEPAADNAEFELTPLAPPSLESQDSNTSIAEAIEMLPELEKLAITSSPLPPPVPQKPLSFSLPPPELRICPASNRQLCSVRMCKYPPQCCQIHLCFFQLQHQSYESSDLLGVLKKQRECRKTAKPKPLSERTTSSGGEQSPATTVPEAAASSSIAEVSSSSSPSASPISDSSLPSLIEPVIARPLVLFLDTNSVFNMISSRREVRHLDWNHLYDLASKGLFGSGFAEPERRVYLVLCSAVLNEMDARKEYNKRSESGAHGQERFQHLTSLAKQIKEQFQLNLPDQSQGFLARSSQLGFLKTISIAQGEMNIHPSMRPSATDSRNTSNDRRILNAALHWSQSVGESGIVLLLTDDRNLQNLSTVEGVPVCSLYALDNALGRSEYSGATMDSITLRSAIASCSKQLQSALSNTNAHPSIRTDKNVYECLEDAVTILTRVLENPPSNFDIADAASKLECWRGVLANAPTLLSAIRQNRNNHV